MTPKYELKSAEERALEIALEMFHEEIDVGGFKRKLFAYRDEAIESAAKHLEDAYDDIRAADAIRALKSDKGPKLSYDGC